MRSVHPGKTFCGFLISAGCGDPEGITDRQDWARYVLFSIQIIFKFKLAKLLNHGAVKR
jgi:hypothetical protein